MPARDRFHEIVRTALISDGWTITQDPLVLTTGDRDLFVDLGAERLLAAERGTQKIAVEVKSFLGPSEVADLEQALGQFILYDDVLSEVDADRVLYLAVSDTVYMDLFEEPIGQLLLRKRRLRLLVFNIASRRIQQWKT